MMAVKIHKYALDEKYMPMFKVKTTWINRRYFDVIEDEGVIFRKELINIVKWRINERNRLLDKQRFDPGRMSLRMKSFTEKYNGSKEKK